MIEQRLYQYIATEHERKCRLKIVPNLTTKIDAAATLMVSPNQISSAAKKLESSGKIIIGRTFTDDYYQINEAPGCC